MRDFLAEAAPTRERLIALAATLPESEHIQQTPLHSAFAVRGKKFCYFLVDHHGDGRISSNVKVAPGTQGDLLANEPDRFYMPAYLGAKGWIGYEFVPEPDWDEVSEMLRQSYLLLAPKTLAAKAPARLGG